MPASPTRVCDTCDEDDVHKGGRRPRMCRYCRAERPAEQAHYARNKERRAAARDYQTNLAHNRDREEFLRDQAESYPEGFKTCPLPDDNGSGCGRTLPLDNFKDSIWQKGGKMPVCEDCAEGYPMLATLS